MLSNVRRDSLQGHDSACTGTFSNLGLLSISNIHYDSTLDKISLIAQSKQL